MLRSLSLREPPRFALRSSPPRLASETPPPETPIGAEDFVELSKPKPEKTSFARRLGQISLGLLSMSGAVVGTAGVVTGVAEIQRMQSCRLVPQLRQLALRWAL